MLLQLPQDETMMPPPISALTTPYASAPLPYLLRHLPSLCSCGTLKICLQRHPQPPLCLILSPLLTILTLRYQIHRAQWLVGVHDERNQGDMLSGHLC
ncbi:hypothetical protein O181_054286 [Austropuccinia psidii MF-1]|uniref:Uncharacterized protein n=1 Tax=Austropuccinia psidii MF-1 TaxID=1389203 RepID=A0A9Q3HQZ1_9BASI|nr:hypothetical protein [Austropuccinia psidii MF-1]